ncbi:HlyU family transcriptional regulator [Pacificoceanicola onchidii]|uniref:HlyU family transcriptional regulator n=1 Tax=Pacificoceanicola onchidii TaxID=2562685 RepID=UPI0010A640F5|nr:HlyU family transcriptional regulator [Pacificoceanicola onchidii]
MAFWKKLFGGGGDSKAPALETIEYEGFRITADPMNEDGQFRLSAVIEAEVDGETKTHRLIRADLIREYDVAVEASVNKAKQMIDQQGKRLF